MNISIIKDAQNDSSASNEIVSRLHKMLQSGELSPGDKLPPERDLAKMLGVSRPTLRNGIRSLSAFGMLKSRRGAGTFFIGTGDLTILDASPLNMMSALQSFSFDEMFEARLALEVHAAGLAAERATTDQMISMAEEVAEMFASIDETERFLKHEIQFRKFIVAASNNGILIALMNMINNTLCEKPNKNVQADSLKKCAENYHHIYRAIRRRASETTKRLMGEHLLESRKSKL